MTFSFRIAADAELLRSKTRQLGQHGTIRPVLLLDQGCVLDNDWNILYLGSDPGMASVPHCSRDNFDRYL